MSQTILLIESNLDLAEVSQSVLITHGFPCFIANDVATGLALIESEEISLVICALDAPTSDGWTMQARVNACLQLENIPVLFTTGALVPDGLPEDNVLQKPFSAEKFLELVKLRTQQSVQS